MTSTIRLLFLRLRADFAEFPFSLAFCAQTPLIRFSFSFSLRAHVSLGFLFRQFSSSDTENVTTEIGDTITITMQRRHYGARVRAYSHTRILAGRLARLDSNQLSHSSRLRENKNCVAINSVSVENVLRIRLDETLCLATLLLSELERARSIDSHFLCRPVVSVTARV